ncbi:MAG: PEP/pyruvate-binding domain-containing protein [Thermoanaerobaculia bacterium]|jgi:CheY-like chemotaxis protein
MSRSRAHDFQDLMRHRIEEVLLVASPYDAFILEQDERLDERGLTELDQMPDITAVSSGAEAIALAVREPRSRLILTTSHIGDMSAVDLARKVRDARPGIPVVLLAYDIGEVGSLATRPETRDVIDSAFLWQGDVRLLGAIVRSVEDRLNVEHDAIGFGVQVILLIEDNVRYTSSFLPVIYDELLAHSHRLLSEGMNLSHKRMRMRARPKILLCRTYEEALEAFERYRDEILGVVSDVEFPRGGARSPEAGLDFAREVRGRVRDVPVVLQSFHKENEAFAIAAGASFLLKGSPVLLHDLRRFMIEYFGFGDFIFRLPGGTEVGRARDMKELEESLAEVPAASIAYHAERNHFSKWLKARTEFALARRLRPERVTDFATHEELRRSLIGAIGAYRRDQNRTLVVDFDRQTFDAGGSFSRIGGGSLGGKARGLAFVRALLSDHRLDDRFPNVEVSVPASVVLGTTVFDRFLDDNALRDFAINCVDDAELGERFRSAPFPREALHDLESYLSRVREPIAVRSSSLLEDSQYQPFTGVYDTVMLTNQGELPKRLERLVLAIKRVYASTFSVRAKSHLRATPYRLEEEKMAVILQRIVGARHGERFYPDFAGVARSINFYPAAPMTAADGIAAVALGFGKAVVEGERCVRFSPRAPHQILHFSSVADVLQTSQTGFWALDLAGGDDAENTREVRFDLDAAERDGTLAAVGSTFSAENDAIYDGVSRSGVRVVTMAQVLKHDAFPLAPLLATLLKIGSDGGNAPVEIEFAVNLSVPRGAPAEFGFLQMRQLAPSRELEELDVSGAQRDALLCRTGQALGNGKIEGVRDLVVVDLHRFERAKSLSAAQEVARLNDQLLRRGTPYLLVGVGRWGSRDPWLGIPVAWEQISGARAIVEAGLPGFKVEPSQGSHFFQNLVSFDVGYFTVDSDGTDDFVDWEWLSEQPALSEVGAVRHLSFPEPLLVKVNGRRHEGVIFKPGRGDR